MSTLHRDRQLILSIKVISVLTLNAAISESLSLTSAFMTSTPCDSRAFAAGLVGSRVMALIFH
jgi:hypothetical protein